MEWFIELFFWRRNRLACQRRLGELDAELAQRDTQIGQVRAHIASVEADLARLGQVKEVDHAG